MPAIVVAPQNYSLLDSCLISDQPVVPSLREIIAAKKEVQYITSLKDRSYVTTSRMEDELITII